MAGRPRIAITGVGLVSALGATRSEVFARVCTGERGLRPLGLFPVSGQRSELAGEVLGLDVREVLGSSWSADASRCDALAMLAAREALSSSPARVSDRLGIVLGGTTGGMYETERGLRELPDGALEPERVRRLLDFPLSISAERVARALGATRSTTLSCACASGAAAIALAASWLLSGRVTRVLAGGVDGLCELTFSGFNALGATDPRPCRPFDAQRNGLNLGEGAGVLMLELEQTARQRDAHVFGWLSGWALGSEAHHVTHPDPAGRRASQLIVEALASAGLCAADIDYVNAHGTGTEQNDAMEAAAIARALGSEAKRVWVSSSKAQLGHTLGAAGAVEAALTVLALEAGRILPAVGLEQPDSAALRFAPSSAEPAKLRAALSNSFGFGGSCAVLAFEEPDAVPRPLPLFTPCRAVISVAVARSSAPNPTFAEEPVAELAPERSRRFGRASALACAGIAELGLPADTLRSAGLALSSAFGDVERSVRFIRRVFSGGARLASPAEFPQLLSSSASGNASLYFGLEGPCLTVSDGMTGAEAALSTALGLLSLAPERPVLAGGVEAFDTFVNALLAPSSPTPRCEGGGFVLLEDEVQARAAGRRPLARVEEQTFGLGAWPEAVRALRAPALRARALVCCSAREPAVLDGLSRSSWARVSQLEPAPAYGCHEAFGAELLAAVVARIAARGVDEALLLSTRGETVCVIRLSAPELEVPT